jgi:hypothetical protein
VMVLLYARTIIKYHVRRAGTSTGASTPMTGELAVLRTADPVKMRIIAVSPANAIVCLCSISHPIALLVCGLVAD